MIAETSSLRRTALLLHAMTPADRQWTLERLPDDRRPALRALLDELRDLGIPPDRSLLAGAALDDAMPPIEKCEPPLTRIDELIDMLRAADPASLAAVLRDEPVKLIAALLNVTHWAWKDDFLAQFEPAKSRRIRQYVAQQRRYGMEQLDPLPERAITVLLSSIHARNKAYAGSRPLETGSKKDAPVRQGRGSWLVHLTMQCVRRRPR
jgi:hypothetical protein